MMSIKETDYKPYRSSYYEGIECKYQNEKILSKNEHIG